MRVIAGSAKGRRLRGPARDDASIRPVEDRVKEAIFSMLWDVTDFRVLDCFAGTGAVGIEALSRGAAHATFIDASARAIALVSDNVQSCDFFDQATLMRVPMARALESLAKRAAQFDLIFVDPPYGESLVTPTLAQIATGKLLKPQGQILIEHHAKDRFTCPAVFIQHDQRLYGETAITFVRWRPQTGE